MLSIAGKVFGSKNSGENSVAIGMSSSLSSGRFGRSRESDLVETGGAP